MILSEVIPRPLGMLKQVVLAGFKPVVTCFGPPKDLKRLINGPFLDCFWANLSLW